MEALSEEAAATPLELFFDLVFVFGLTQVTALMAEDLTVRGLTRGLLVLGLLWWSWVGYAWLGSVVRSDEGPVRMAMLAAMAAMLVLALTIPEAFNDSPGGLSGPVVVGLCYFAFRALHLTLFWIISRNDEGLRRQLLRFAPAMLGGTLLLLAASRLKGGEQTALWAAALLADYGGTLLGGSRGWRLRSSKHFAERHGLILIVSLGESIVAIGVGMTGLPISWAIVITAVVGLGLSAVLWWAYFDITSLMAEGALSATPESDRPRLARDAYSFLHLPLIAGVVLVALGMKKVLEYVGDSQRHDLSDPLTGIGLYALYGGVSLYLLGQAAFKLRTLHVLTVSRLAIAVGLIVLLPLAAAIPALAALTMLTALAVGLVIFETRRAAEHRDRIRHEEPPHASTIADPQS
jgi:low temperature requirement protein LtrA